MPIMDIIEYLGSNMHDGPWMQKHMLLFENFEKYFVVCFWKVIALSPTLCFPK
jgi:hypothetical protein